MWREIFKYQYLIRNMWCEQNCHLHYRKETSKEHQRGNIRVIMRINEVYLAIRRVAPHKRLMTRGDNDKKEKVKNKTKTGISR